MVTVTSFVEVGGRRLAYDTWGDPAGLPVFFLHGTPSCRLERYPDDEALAGTGARVLTYDRPGYGRSDRHPGRTVVDCVADVAAVADDLGVDRFAVTGASGGGPHALAVAARLPERVLRAACVVGVAPYDVPDLDWTAGMDPANVREFGWALAGEGVLVPELERVAAQDLARVAVDPASLLDDFQLSDADRAALQDPRVQQVFRETTVEAYATGVWGWVDDDLAVLGPWGFELAEIRVPVEVWYGETDVMVPAAHGRWLAGHVPGAEVHVESGEGHLGDPDQSLARLRDFVAAASRSPEPRPG